MNHRSARCLCDHELSKSACSIVLHLSRNILLLAPLVPMLICHLFVSVATHYWMSRVNHEFKSFPKISFVLSPPYLFICGQTVAAFQPSVVRDPCSYCNIAFAIHSILVADIFILVLSPMSKPSTNAHKYH